MNFKSQICTMREQSERLLALGVKPETADMSSDGWNDPVVSWGMEWSKEVIESGRLPAWSLDRLKELYKCVGDTSLWNLDDVNYDRLIQCIGLAIKHNSFNKEYLQEQAESRREEKR